jgi:hypothetical protein
MQKSPVNHSNNQQIHFKIRNEDNMFDKSLPMMRIKQNRAASQIEITFRKDLQQENLKLNIKTLRERGGQSKIRLMPITD